jgi:hypothetical protein
MKIVTRPRGGGKTTEAIEWLLEGDRASNSLGWTRALLVANESESRRVREIVRGKAFGLLRYENFQRYGIPVVSVVDVRFSPEQVLPREGVQVMVDNADMVLSALLGAQLAGVTITTDEQVAEPQGGDASWV